MPHISKLLKTCFKNNNYDHRVTRDFFPIIFYTRYYLLGTFVYSKSEHTAQGCNKVVTVLITKLFQAHYIRYLLINISKQRLGKGNEERGSNMDSRSRVEC